MSFLSGLNSLAAVTACAAAFPFSSYAAPYASRVVISGGTNVSFTLNEPADSLAYRINGGPLQPLDGSIGGTKSFSLGVPTDTFDVIAIRTPSDTRFLRAV